ncbi:MAG: hypothetical protein V4726_22725 [Verrucomicrobiota bacterium]
MMPSTERRRESRLVRGGIAMAFAAGGWGLAAWAFSTSPQPSERMAVPVTGTQPPPAASLPARESAAGRFTRLRDVPVNAVPGVITTLDPAKNLTLIRVLLRRLAESDPLRAMEVLEGLDLAEEQNLPGSAGGTWTRPRDTLMNAVLSAWTASDATASDAWIRKNVRPPMRLELETVKALAEADPSRTVKTLEEVCRPHLQGRLMAAVFPSLLQRPGGPAECQAIALEISRRIPQSGVLEGLFGNWSRTDPAAALAWVENLPAEALSSKATSGLELVVGKVSPRSGLMLNLRILSGQLDSEGYRDLFQNTIDRGFEKIRGGSGLANFAVQHLLENFSSWAAQDPGAARSWVAGQEESPASMAMAAQIPSALAGKSPAGAVSALNGLPPSLQAGSAMGLARTMMDRAPEQVVELAAQIETPEVRDSYLETAFSRMAQYDRAAVARHIGLISSPTVRQRLEKLGK